MLVKMNFTNLITAFYMIKAETIQHKDKTIQLVHGRMKLLQILIRFSIIKHIYLALDFVMYGIYRAL